MRQHQLAGQITDSPNVIHERGAPFLDAHKSTLHREIERIEAAPGRPRAPSRGDEDLVRRYVARRPAPLGEPAYWRRRSVAP
jgi:hypothetical protein